MHSLRYAGDENSNRKNFAWLESTSDDDKYSAVCKFVCDFHTPKESSGTREPDTEYKDYQFWLVKNSDGDMELVSWGY